MVAEIVIPRTCGLSDIFHLNATGERLLILSPEVLRCYKPRASCCAVANVFVVLVMGGEERGGS